MNMHLMQKQLLPADRLIHPIAGFLGVKHHGVFLGEDSFGVQWVSENHKTNGVRIVTARAYLAEYGEVERVLPFDGNMLQRQYAVKRAFAVAGKTYNLITNNCEHHANFVQTGVSASHQVAKGVFCALVALCIAIACTE